MAKPTRRPASRSLRARALRRIRNPVKPRAKAPSNDPKRIIHELRIHQIELEMQNDELLAAQAAGKEARVKYKEFYEQAPVGYFTLDSKGLVQESNPAGTALVGRTRQQLLGKPFVLCLMPESRPAFQQFLARLLKTRESQTCEVLPQTGRAPAVAVLLKGVGMIRNNRLAAILLAVSDISDRKRAETQLQLSHDRLEDLAMRLQRAREEECTRIAHEVHDELGQRLTLLKLEISALARKLEGATPWAKGELLDMERTVDDTIRSVQDIAIRLRPMVLDRFGLVPAIKWAVQEFQSRTGIPCRLDLVPDPVYLDRDRALAVFRIVQEALTNVSRHAKATEVTLRLSLQDRLLRLEVSDNGRGIAPHELTSPLSLGVSGIQQRAALLRGQAVIVGVPRKGTTVSVIVPLPDVQERGQAKIRKP